MISSYTLTGQNISEQFPTGQGKSESDESSEGGGGGGNVGQFFSRLKKTVQHLAG